MASAGVRGAGAFGGSSPFFPLLLPPSPNDPCPLVAGFFNGIRCGVLGGLFVVVFGGLGGIGVLGVFFTSLGHCIESAVF